MSKTPIEDTEQAKKSGIGCLGSTLLLVSRARNTACPRGQARLATFFPEGILDQSDGARDDLPAHSFHQLHP